MIHLFHVRRPHRSYTIDELNAFLRGSTNPVYALLVGREDEVKKWLADVKAIETIDAARKNLQQAKDSLNEAKDEVVHLRYQIRQAEEDEEAAREAIKDAEEALEDALAALPDDLEVAA